MDTNKLKALALAASPGPWRGDRYDGTVKYMLLDANGDPVIRGDNGNSDSGPFGIDSEEDEAYLLAAHPATVLELIAERDELRAEVERLRADAGRYRFLRDVLIVEIELPHYVGHIDDDEIDEAIDAAIEKEKA